MILTYIDAFDLHKCFRLFQMLRLSTENKCAEARDMKINCFNGKGKVVKFLKKMELRAAVKGYVDEQKAQNLASRLTGPVYEV